MIKGLLFFIKFSWINKKSYLFLNVIHQLLIGFLPIISITIPTFIIDELLGQQHLLDITFY